MNRIATDGSEHTAADCSDLRITNPWLASYGRNAVRATRPSTPAALNLRFWAGAGAAVLFVLGIGAKQYVAAAGTHASPGHYPLEQNGGIAVASAQLDEYLPFSAGSTQLGDREQGESVRMAETIVQGVAQSRLTAESAEEQPLLENRAQSSPMEPLR